MLVYPSGVDVSSSALRFLATRLRERRRAVGTRLRRLNAGRQAAISPRPSSSSPPSPPRLPKRYGPHR